MVIIISCKSLVITQVDLNLLSNKINFLQNSSISSLKGMTSRSSSVSSETPGNQLKEESKHFCLICGKTLSRRDSLRRHLIKIHKKLGSEAIFIMNSMRSNSVFYCAQKEEYDEDIVFAVDCSTHEVIQ